MANGGQTGASVAGVAGASNATEIGATCTSSSGLTGTVQIRCAMDDAFCESIANGYYCTGWKPFVCPSGQVRTGWTSCGFPAGGQSNASTGGDAGASGSPSANTGQGGAGGDAASPNGSQGGAASTCWTLQPWSADGCGTCQMTLAQYCANADCTPATLPTCDKLPGAYSIDEGCGLLKLRMSGHGGEIYTESIYDQATRALEYYYDNGGRSAGCMPELTVGTKPTCENWTTLCEGLGGA